jgi:tRNA1Val (adenine37-N6)-methyltransferase
MKQKTKATLDAVKNVQLLQSRSGYRFSMDAVLLESFIPLRRYRKGIELGTGSGIVSILLAKRIRDIRISAVEIQKPLADRARKNVEINGLEDRIEVLNMDMTGLRKVFPPNGFDIVFSNPPFRKTQTGRLSVNGERAAARHETMIKLPDFISTASYLLKSNGRLCIIYHPFRLIELVSLLMEKHLEPKSMRFVYPRTGKEAKMVLVEAVKNAGTWLTIDPPLFTHDDKGEYTEEMKKIYQVI